MNKKGLQATLVGRGDGVKANQEILTKMKDSDFQRNKENKGIIRTWGDQGGIQNMKGTRKVT